MSALWRRRNASRRLSARLLTASAGAALLVGSMPAALQAEPSRQGGCTVGVSWNNFQEERWAKWDEPAIKAALAEGGANYVSNDAKSSAETQANNVDNLISKGAKGLSILAQGGTAIKPSVTEALNAG